ncbi:unnamed protein product [Symbiodinium sp. KB8]|nr:unnamed protein product [Symbiodinium sp. KB8]
MPSLIQKSISSSKNPTLSVPDLGISAAAKDQLKLEAGAKELESLDSVIPSAAESAGRGEVCARSRSRFGEELSVIRLLGWQMKRDGIYVEMGALDGVTYSSTLALQTCLGWTGLLIEGSPRHFQRLYQNYKDVENVIVQYGAVCAPPLTNATFSQGMNVGSVDGDVTYLPVGLRKRFSYRRQRVVVPCRPMEWYLQKLPKKHVDFMSLDVEGAELEVLLTMDFAEVLVEVFLIELHDWGRSEQTQSWKIRKLMGNLGYKDQQLGREGEDSLMIRSWVA